MAAVVNNQVELGGVIVHLRTRPHCDALQRGNVALVAMVQLCLNSNLNFNFNSERGQKRGNDGVENRIVQVT